MQIAFLKSGQRHLVYSAHWKTVTDLVILYCRFSITAYLTLALLILHYVTVHDYHRTNGRGKEYSNPIDRSVLIFIRQRVFAWTPSRRFEYAMEKAVLILSDAQLVTGLAILISGYSQLNCGISAYHWQIMVCVVPGYTLYI